jgi:hypothetical protein
MVQGGGAEGVSCADPGVVNDGLIASTRMSASDRVKMREKEIILSSKPGRCVDRRKKVRTGIQSPSPIPVSDLLLIRRGY